MRVRFLALERGEPDSITAAPGDDPEVVGVGERDVRRADRGLPEQSRRLLCLGGHGVSEGSTGTEEEGDEEEVTWTTPGPSRGAEGDMHGGSLRRAVLDPVSLGGCNVGP